MSAIAETCREELKGVRAIGTTLVSLNESITQRVHRQTEIDAFNRLCNALNELRDEIAFTLGEEKS